ncbi:hypothetical protein EXIGLDRAFT_839567 [Exidia glandulosa HHB12029]|uniref:DUF6534 domain-containing protein n=1 Tax=Exidia glandulosa HHB12029 TaxID=1314781 RepID=A0A165EYJ8_EXIGL|nr:hypothetical protein EXIGLDRAFT_839567 [Exidia glandulosa HHB12029]
MSTGNPFVNAVIERRIGYLGPFLCGALVQCIQMGIILDQASRYFFTWEPNPVDGVSKRPKEKILVLSVITIALFQTVAAIWSIFTVHVAHFGDWLYALNFGWADKMQPIVTMSMAAPVQAFLIWRVVKALDRRWWAIVPLFALQAVSVITSIVTTVQAFQLDFGAPSADSDAPPPPPPPPPGTPLPIDPTYVIYLASSAALDAATTSILAAFLLRSRMKSSSDYTRNLIRRLIFVVWQAALPPALCALAGVFVYIVTIRASGHSEIFGVRPGFWDLFFQLVLGKFYVISLLATVNGRAEILRSATALTAENISMSTRSARGRRLTQMPMAINVNVTRTSVTEGRFKSPAQSPRGDNDTSTFELKGIRETTEGTDSEFGQAV